MMKKTSRIHMPIYNDGLFEVFEIIEDDSVQANTSLQSKDISMTYQELGVSDRLRSDLDSHDIDIQLKIRVPYVKGFIDSMSVLKIDEHFYKVYNIYHFVDNNGFKQSDITLVNWEGEYDEENGFCQCIK